MSWFNFKKSKINNEQIEERQQTYGEVYNWTPLSEHLGFGMNSSSATAMNISAVYRAVSIISDSIAMLPIRVKITGVDHTEYLPNHNLNLVFKDGFMSKYNLMKLLVQSVMLKGNGFAYIHRTADGKVSDIQFLESGDVSIQYNKQKRELYYICSNLPRKRVNPENMIHLVKNSWDGINGISVLKFASRSIAIANNVDDAANDFFSSGCNLSGVLTIQGQVSADQRKQMIESWRANFTQGGKGVAVLQGNTTYSPVQINSEDAEMLASRQYTVQDIARFFEISPVLLGDLTNASYNTIEAVQNDFLLHTLSAYIHMIEEEFSRKLISPSESNLSVILDSTEILKTDKTATASYYNSLLQSGVYCINEVRKELGYSPIEGGDKHIIPFTDINANSINNNDREGNQEPEQSDTADE